MHRRHLILHRPIGISLNNYPDHYLQAGSTWVVRCLINIINHSSRLGLMQTDVQAEHPRFLKLFKGHRRNPFRSVRIHTSRANLGECSLV